MESEATRKRWHQRSLWHAAVVLFTVAVICTVAAMLVPPPDPVTEYRVPMPCPQEDSCFVEYRREQDGAGAWWIIVEKFD